LADQATTTTLTSPRVKRLLTMHWSP